MCVTEREGGEKERERERGETKQLLFKVTKKYLRENFKELSDELLNRIRSVYKYCIDSLFVFCKDSF